MIKVSITVDRAPQDVWNYITQPKNWKDWWGGGVKTVKPGWKTGAEVVWELGGSSPILELTPNKLLKLEGTWMDTTITLTPKANNSTLIELEEGDPKMGASYNDGGAAQKRNYQEGLQKLKRGIEAIPAASSA